MARVRFKHHSAAVRLGQYNTEDVDDDGRTL